MRMMVAFGGKFSGSCFAFKFYGCEGKFYGCEGFGQIILCFPCTCFRAWRVLDSSKVWRCTIQYAPRLPFQQLKLCMYRARSNGLAMIPCLVTVNYTSGHIDRSRNLELMGFQTLTSHGLKSIKSATAC